MDKIKTFSTARRLSLSIGAIVIVTGIFSIAATNYQMKAYALVEAREKARILLEGQDHIQKSGTIGQSDRSAVRP